ncbi:hypothetical protein E3N88_13190 [Mikania micrantha]|uniref:Uncharacterized protein n=1 Tax=Mikania micrantha TaxID=192012 RepID=A0A5N6P7N6_9ASTR|nr:hypothetical protein E3N88_13190 [Mikania micrantha]
MASTTCNSIIAAQLSTISVRLDAILAHLKEDIAAIKALMEAKELEDDPQGSLTDLVKNTTSMKDDVAAIKAQTDEKEPEDAPQDPLTDLIMEVNNGGSPVSGVVKVLESDTLEVLVEKYAGETQINKAEQVLMKCDPENRLEIFANSSDTSHLSLLPEVAGASMAKSKVQIRVSGILTSEGSQKKIGENWKEMFIKFNHRWIYEKGQPTLEWLIAWHNLQCYPGLVSAGLQQSSTISFPKAISSPSGCHSNRPRTLAVSPYKVFDNSPRGFLRADSNRLEDKSFLRAGSIDTNLGRDPSSYWSKLEARVGGKWRGSKFKEWGSWSTKLGI